LVGAGRWTMPAATRSVTPSANRRASYSSTARRGGLHDQQAQRRVDALDVSFAERGVEDGFEGVC
jgi:hypothetical protein